MASWDIPGINPKDLAIYVDFLKSKGLSVANPEALYKQSYLADEFVGWQAQNYSGGEKLVKAVNKESGQVSLVKQSELNKKARGLGDQEFIAFDSPEGQQVYKQIQQNRQFNAVMEKYLPGWSGKMTDKSRESWLATADEVAKASGFEGGVMEAPPETLDRIVQITTSPEGQQFMDKYRGQLETHEREKMQNELRLVIAGIGAMTGLASLAGAGGAVSTAGVGEIGGAIGGGLKKAGGDMGEVGTALTGLTTAAEKAGDTFTKGYDIKTGLPEDITSEAARRLLEKGAGGSVGEATAKPGFWDTLKDRLVGAGITTGLESYFDQPKKRALEEQYGETKAGLARRLGYTQAEAETERQRTEEDYARSQDELRRSQHLQDIMTRERLAQRGITPQEQSSIGTSEWGRQREKQTAEKQGLDLWRKRRMEDIGTQLSQAQTETAIGQKNLREAYKDAVPHFGDSAVENAPALVGGLLKEAGKEILPSVFK